jgi:hypothetical protein
LEASQQFSFLQSRVVRPTPNPHPGGPIYYFYRLLFSNLLLFSLHGPLACSNWELISQTMNSFRQLGRTP